MKLTQANVSKFKMPAGKSEHIEFDEGMPGFGLRIRKGENREHRTFIAQYKIGAKHRRIMLGNAAKVTLDNARKEAKKVFGKVAIGEDPANEKTAARAEASNTLDGLITAYLEARKAEFRPRSYEATEYHLNTLWKPLHKFTMAAVNRGTIAAQVRVIAKENGPVAANRARATLSAFFRWCIGEGLADENPVIGTNKQEENGPRERVLTDADAAAVYLAAPDNEYGKMVRLFLLTGCRRNEIGSLQWPEIDLEARTITLPKERTKNGQEHIVPLCDAALEILETIPRRDKRPFVFGSGEGGYSGWSKSKAELDKVAKVKEPWTLHDLRRTVRTGFGMLGVAPHVAEAALNHLPPKLIRTYDRNNYAKEIKAAFDLWTGHLAIEIAKANGANVTRLSGAKAGGVPKPPAPMPPPIPRPPIPERPLPPAAKRTART
jgi:integrase